MLYGQPGTGKTATVLQWAKKNKRSVFLVDISQIRGKYLGDTERNAKRIFNEYYTMSEKETNTPILLFNEADGVIQKRLDVSHSIEASLNAMQNILLQEMENFKGILVATTNLNKNMDEAFERRFLWKVQIGHPDTETQDRMMWSAFKGEINRQEARLLSGQFSMTGGQLMNVRRKFLLETITHPRMNRFLCLSELCQQELNFGTKASRKEIGF
jgi:SpoVK/Ycf46/Vps4 family AAA+-type ATPase